MKKLLLLIITTLLAFSSSTFAVDRTWNFMNWSAATLANLAADVTNWVAPGSPPSITRYSNLTAITAGTTIMANGVAIAETNGLTFSAFAADKLRLDYNTNPGRLIMNASGLIINVPDCKAGDTLVVYTKTTTSGSARGITIPVENAVRFSGAETSADSLINVFTVVADGVVPITNPSGLQYRLIAVSAPGTPAVNPISTGISTTTLNAIPVKTIYYNLSGLVAGDNFASLRKGLYIQKTWYSNGKALNSKLVKASE